MRGKHIGEFEELILLVVAALDGKAYAVSIKLEIEDKSDRRVSISAIHSTVYRLEKKGLLDSDLGEATKTRGGKSKRLFIVTPLGFKLLEEAENLRKTFRSVIPRFQNIE